MPSRRVPDFRTRPAAARRSPHTNDRCLKLLQATFLVPPVTILSLFVLILSYSLTQTPQAPKLTTPASDELSTTPLARRVTSDKSPTLPELLCRVTDALDDVNVTYWLLPGLGLLPPLSPSFHGRLNPWQDGVDLGVHQDDLMKVILAQTSMQATGILAVESYFGLRLFHVSGQSDERYDFRVPFVDILYFKEDQGHVLSFCCDCAPVAISACTKKTCGCLVCASKMEEVFPLAKVWIEGMQKSMWGPRRIESLLLPGKIEGVHPAVFND